MSPTTTDHINGPDAVARIKVLRAKLIEAEAMREHHAACCRDYLARNQQLEQRADAAEARVTFLKSRFDDLACQIEDSRYYGKTSVTGPTKFLYEIADRCRVTLELLNHVGGAK